MAGFSASLKLTGLDYIAPSQACVLPLQGEGDGTVAVHPRQKRNQQAAAAAGTKEEKIKLELADCLACSGCVTTAETMLVQEQSLFKFYEILQACGKWAFPAPPPKAPFDTDEGAAESAGVGGAAVQAYKKLVVSIAPQSLASLAARLGVAPAVAWAKVAALFKTKLQCDEVFDLVWAQDVTLIETLAEVRDKYATAQRERAAAGGPPPQPKRPKRAAVALGEEAPAAAPAAAAASVPSLPLITSACPGLVCYVEKTERKLLPHLSTARSSQSVFGTLLKKACAARWAAAEGVASWDAAITEADVCHVTIQPCYDRKLEASRREFQWEAGAADPTPSQGDAGTGPTVKATDLVLATHELFELLDAVAAAEEGRTLQPAAEGDAPPAAAAGGVEYLMGLESHAVPWSSQFGGQLLREAFGLGGAGTPPFFLEGSGGFCPIVLREIGKLHGVDVVVTDFEDTKGHAAPDTTAPEPYRLRVSSKRANFTEYELFVNGASVFTAATCYGFQNIRNLARSTRVRAAPYVNYDFIELMACPDGCVNGGGQIRTTHYPATPDAPAPTNRQLIDSVKASYHAHVNDAAAALAAAAAPSTLKLDGLHGLLGGAPYSDRARVWLHTTFNDLGEGETVGGGAPSLASMTW